MRPRRNARKSVFPHCRQTIILTNTGTENREKTPFTKGIFPVKVKNILIIVWQYELYNNMSYFTISF